MPLISYTTSYLFTNSSFLADIHQFNCNFSKITKKQTESYGKQRNKGLLRGYLY